MAKNKVITPEEMRLICEQDAHYSAIVDSFERAKQFKVNDFLILMIRDGIGGWATEKNSYGAPIKYKVVYTSESGIPFMQEVNAHGTLIGNIICGLDHLDDGCYIDHGQVPRWQLDPDYADSLLLQQEYDPSLLHNNRKQIWKEITEHNKKAKINTQGIPQIVDFLKTLKQGDTIWTSNVSHYMVQDIKLLSKSETSKIIKENFRSRVKGPFVLVATIVDKKGVVKDVAADFFYYKALYKERPRSYKELNL